MWLLEESTRLRLEAVSSEHIQDLEKKEAEFKQRALDKQKRLYSIVVYNNKNVANIEIKGILTEEPDFFAEWIYGANTVYSDINKALKDAEENSNIDRIQLNINSPGGEIDGFFDTVAVLQSVTKPMTANVTNLAASAAYAIASQADSITVNNRAARVGSVGVVVSMYVSENVVDITSSNAPAKRPDVMTKEGKAMVREELDALEELFIEAIAEGRGTTTVNVKKNFGRGSVVIADEAKRRGMIDEVAGSSPVSKINNKNEGKKKVDLETLKAEHAELYKIVHDSGIEAGRGLERDRVSAHLTLGEASGSLKTAVEAIKNGSDLTQELNAKYMAAAMNRGNLNTQISDEAPIVTPKDPVESIEDAVIAGIKDRVGYNL